MISTEYPVCGHINHLDEDEEQLCEICDAALHRAEDEKGSGESLGIIQNDYEAYQEWRKVLDEIPFNFDFSDEALTITIRDRELIRLIIDVIASRIREG